MKEKKKGFIMYNDYLTFIEILNTEERGIVFTAVMQYVNGIEPDLSDASNGVKISYSMIKQCIDRDVEKYEETCRSRARAAKAREENKKAQAGTKSTIVTDIDKERDKDTDKEKDKDNDKERDTEKEKETDTVTESEKEKDTEAETSAVCSTQQDDKTLSDVSLSENSLSEKNEPLSSDFIPPTLSEVTTYCYERKSCIDPERFIDYYTANNWMFGKVKMSDWHAAVRAWEKNERRDGKRETSPGNKSAPSYDIAEVEKLSCELYRDL